MCGGVLADFRDAQTSEQNLRESIRKRVEMKIATEEQIFQSVNLVIDKCADWSANASASIQKFFREAAESDRSITAQEIQDWLNYR